MKRSTFIGTLLLIWLVNFSVFGQESSDTSNTWYVWINTEVPIDGDMVKIVSKEPMIITCCPQSAKYRKFVKKAAKWITENISPTYNEELSLMKIQDKDLAYQTVAELREKEGVKVIEYSASCK